MEPTKERIENSNKEFLNWIYERMVCVHGERDMFDYMINFKSIIDSMPDVERSQQELQAYKDIIKELLPLAEKTFDSIARHEVIYAPNKLYKEEVAEIIDKARKLIE